MRRHAKGLFVVAALCSFFAIGAAPALADYGVVGYFGTGPEEGGSGSGNGELSDPGQAEVSSTTGRLYVADTANDRVQVFKPTATAAEYESQAAIAGPTGLAIDQASGDVYVATATGISKFTSSLTPAGGWADPGVTGALAVDPSSGDLLVADTAGNLIRRYDSSGSADGSFPAARPVDVAANSSGEVFVVTTTGNLNSCGPTSAVERFSAAGVSAGTLTPLTVPGSVAVDPDDDSIAVGAKVNEYFCEFGNLPEVVFFDSDGTFREAAQLNLGATMWSSIPAVTVQGGGSERVYAITKSPMNDPYGLTRVFVLLDLVPPVATIGTATDVAPFSATLRGEVNPGGSAATCRFEYSVGTSFSRSVPCATNPGSGTSPVAVQVKVTGLATDTEYNFRLVATNNNGAMSKVSGSASFTTTHADKPAVTIAPPSGVASTSAKLSGTIDPRGNPASYRFEYQRLGDAGWTPVPGGSGSAGSGSGAVTREAELKDLFTNSTYRVRLSASNGAGTELSAIEQFTTPSSAPVIAALGAGQVSMTSAQLRAAINPAGEATSYYFEYGPSPDYGSRLPASGAISVGAGNAAVFVSRALEGLQPGTVYHFRVVAENGTGVSEGQDRSFMTATTPSACPNEAIRERQGALYLPDCRAFELVSPADKDGNDVIVPDTSKYRGDFAPLSGVSGDQVAFVSHGPFAEAKSHPVYSVFRAIRGSDGWSTQNLVPYLSGAWYAAPQPDFRRFNEDLSAGVMFLRGTSFTPDAIEGAGNFYLRDLRADSYRLLTVGKPAGDASGGAFGGWSRDRDTVAFVSYGGVPLTADAPTGVNVLYQWDAATGELSLVGRQPGTNLPFDGRTEIANPSSRDLSVIRVSPATWNPVSEDGKKIYFYAPGKPNQQLYLRLDGTETVHVSASQADDPDPNGTQPARFHFASRDGEVAFFSSKEKLTDDATTQAGSSGGDLYRYDVADERLTDITVDPGDPLGAEIQGVIGGSDDGKRVYFVAKGELDDGAVAGADNLYLWVDDGSPKGSIEFVSQGVGLGNWEGASDERRLGRVTPDGMHALFQSTARLSSYDNAGKNEVYVYDGASAEVTCVSCNPTGVAASAGALALGTGDEQASARLLSDDGRFAFFNTTEALVPSDVNNRMDAYRYDADRDRVDLVSTGSSEFPAQFTDASADGKNVFIATRQKLLSADFDDSIDVYDVRVGGGFLSQSPPPPPVPCFGEACRSEPAVPPGATNPSSSTLTGKGNVNERKQAKKSKKKQKKKKKKQKKKKQKKKSKLNKVKHEKQGARR